MRWVKILVFRKKMSNIFPHSISGPFIFPAYYQGCPLVLYWKWFSRSFDPLGTNRWWWTVYHNQEIFNSHAHFVVSWFEVTQWKSVHERARLPWTLSLSAYMICCPQQTGVSKLFSYLLFQIPFDLSVYPQWHGSFHCQLYFIGCGYIAQTSAIPWRAFIQYQ